MNDFSTNNEPVPQPDDRWDVVVVGAGAAGLLTATHAAERGRRTLLLEKNRRPGVKILISGGTRCNLTHATDNRGIIAAFGPPGRFLHSALAALSVDDTLALFAAEGLQTKVEETGKIFPHSDKATDVLAALLARLERSGAQLAVEEPLLACTPHDTGFRLQTAGRKLATQKLVLTTGGQSYPRSGTTGDGYRLAAALGHTIVRPRPALVPLRVTLPWVHDLKGMTLPDVGVRLVESPAAAPGSPTGGRHKGALAECRGSFLFAHFGLSGPVVLDISREVTAHPAVERLALVCDFLPNLPIGAFEEALRSSVAAAGKKQLAGLLAEWVPRRLAEALLSQLALPADRKVAEVSRRDWTRIAESIKRMPIPLVGTRGFEKAEVTAGGIALEEVDSRSLESKLVPGLYLAGEVLDLDGPIGGYNFQAAWSTGWLAGQSV